MPATGETLRVRHRLLIVDDHPIVRHGLAGLIAAETDLEICGQAASVAEARAFLDANPCDVAIVDISLEDENGLHLIEEIRNRFPETKVLVSSIHDEATYAPRALRAGALGYIEKREAITKVVEAVRHILKGEVYLSARMTNQLLQRAAVGDTLSRDPVSTLSNRELEVFEMIGRGITVKQIARKLGVSPKTVESHRKKIRDKLGLKNSTQLNRQAFDWVRDHT